MRRRIVHPKGLCGDGATVATGFTVIAAGEVFALGFSRRSAFVTGLAPCTGLDLESPFGVLSPSLVGSSSVSDCDPCGPDCDSRCFWR
jgi:hypothetical protein